MSKLQSVFVQFTFTMMLWKLIKGFCKKGGKGFVVHFKSSNLAVDAEVSWGIQPFLIVKLQRVDLIDHLIISEMYADNKFELSQLRDPTILDCETSKSRFNWSSYHFWNVCGQKIWVYSTILNCKTLTNWFNWSFLKWMWL